MAAWCGEKGPPANGGRNAGLVGSRPGGQQDDGKPDRLPKVGGLKVPKGKSFGCPWSTSRPDRMIGLVPLVAGDTDLPHSVEDGVGEDFSMFCAVLGLADLRPGVRRFSSIESEVLPAFDAGLGVSLLRLNTFAS